MTIEATEIGPTPPAVRFGSGRRPEASTQVRLEAFDGPLALLLALIEARQLDVTTVPPEPLAKPSSERLRPSSATRPATGAPALASAGHDSSRDSGRSWPDGCLT